MKTSLCDSHGNKKSFIDPVRDHLQRLSGTRRDEKVVVLVVPLSPVIYSLLPSVEDYGKNRLRLMYYTSFSNRGILHDVVHYLAIRGPVSTPVPHTDPDSDTSVLLTWFVRDTTPGPTKPQYCGISEISKYSKYYCNSVDCEGGKHTPR